MGVIQPVQIYALLEVRQQCPDGPLTIKASGPNPEMVFTTIDGRDMTVADSHKRLVTVTLAMPGWEGPIVKGYHSKPE